MRQIEVHRVVLYVVDHDQLGSSEVIDVLENARYPNRCMSPDVASIETVSVEWSDDHPLNRSDTKDEALAKLFG
jgi:hypothetical protein